MTASAVYNILGAPECTDLSNLSVYFSWPEPDALFAPPPYSANVFFRARKSPSGHALSFACALPLLPTSLRASLGPCKKNMCPCHPKEQGWGLALREIPVFRARGRAVHVS